MLGKALTTAAAGSAAGGAAGGLGIEDVFSTWLYTGSGSTQTITNGIDLSGEGGLVWIKNRDGSYNHNLVDTERGYQQNLATNSTSAQFFDTLVGGFTSSGFVAQSPGSSHLVNYSNEDYASWTFRKAPGFFDIVTYTGTGSVQNISHNLGSVPGTIIIKSTTNTSYWPVYHRSLGAGKAAYLNVTDAAYTNSVFWNNTAPTSTQFTVGTASYLNANGQTYVAYVFAHDEQIFGESGSESVIKCGSYTGNGSSTGPVINLGWEPQWVFIKCASRTVGGSTYGGNGYISDNMRGINTGSGDPQLQADESNNEGISTNIDISLTPTGFQLTGSGVGGNASGGTYIYIAIRRGPMKTPTDATTVYSNVKAQMSSGTERTVGFPADLVISTGTDFEPNVFEDRLRGFSRTNSSGEAPALLTHSTAAESTTFPPYVYDVWNTTRKDGSRTSTYTFSWNHFRRAPGFFDMVTYTGTGSTVTASHNLGVTPELIIVKRRDASAQWFVDSVGTNNRGELNSTTLFSSGLIFNNGVTDSSISTTYTGAGINVSGGKFIVYLFATCPGVSKVGSYTGTASTLNVDCGFSAGARFVLIKRTDDTGDWYAWDTARGIVSGNDPYKIWNSYANEVTTTDYIDPYSAGFTVTSSAPAALNASGGSYIFLSIA